ncbi:MAG TPA: hypothetical protein VFG76_06875 [Candidatus Polarisedimenticolia bacterium]|nr:hypothetical protein [Candidatus Polarisedimenticolia bacterium]
MQLDVGKAIAALGDVANRLPRTISVGVRSGVNLLVRHVTMSKLRGQVLRRRTGTLIRSITASPRFIVRSEFIRGIFGSHLDYARYHEEGYRGPIRVPRHVRRAHRVREHMRRNPVTGRLGHVRAHRVAAHQVREHIANVNIPAKYFLLNTVREMGPEAARRVRRAIIYLMRNRRPPTAADLASGASV